MFNRRIGDDLAARAEIVRDAVNASRVPGQSQSSGNAAGLISIASNVLPEGGFISGVSADGVAHFICLTDIDLTDSGAVTE